MVHAFPLKVKPDLALEAARNRNKVDVESLVASPRAETGMAFKPLFQINDRTTRMPRTGLADVVILMYHVGGGWQERRPAIEFAPGVYGAEFRPDEPGIYNVCVACASTGLALHEGQKLTLQVFDAANSGRPAGLLNDKPLSSDSQ